VAWRQIMWPTVSVCACCSGPRVTHTYRVQVIWPPGIEDQVLLVLLRRAWTEEPHAAGVPVGVLYVQHGCAVSISPRPRPLRLRRSRERALVSHLLSIVAAAWHP